MTTLTLTDGSQVELVYPVDRPAVPGLNSLGLSHVRDDLLSSALMPTWSVEPPATPLPTVRPAAVTA
jgi:hypothetical protein